MNDKNHIINLLNTEIKILQQIIDKIESLKQSFNINDIEAINKIIEEINKLYTELSKGDVFISRHSLKKQLNTQTDNWSDIIPAAKLENEPSVNKLIEIYNTLSSKTNELSLNIVSRIKDINAGLNNIEVSRKISNKYRSLSKMPKISIFIDKKK
ncbi:MAG: hypothetical protein AB1765_02010 [Candidatus Hydrogenedentota bacterium]